MNSGCSEVQDASTAPHEHSVLHSTELNRDTPSCLKP